MTAKGMQAVAGYRALLESIKERVRSAQLRASFAVNRELIVLYWQRNSLELKASAREI